MNDPERHVVYFRNQRVWPGVVCAVLGTFLFALKSIVIKLALSAGTNATVLLTLRMVLSCPFYLGMLYYLRDRELAQRRTDVRLALRAILLGFFGYYLASYLDMAGLERISAQLERLTLFTYPMMVAVLARMFLGERIDRGIVLGLGLSYLGIVLMYVQERQWAHGSNVTTGTLLVLGSAISYSVYVLFSKPIMLTMGSRRFTSLAMLGSTLFVVIHCAATQPSHQLRVAPVIWLYGMLLAVVCTVIPSFLINEAIVRLGAARTTTVGTAGPAMTMLLAISILGERTSANHIAGMVLTATGIACSIHFRERPVPIPPVHRMDKTKNAT